MLILYKNARNVRIVLFTKTSNVHHTIYLFHLKPFPFRFTFFSPEIAFVTKETKGVTDTIDFPLLAKYLGIIPKSKICLDPDQSVSFHIKEIQVMFPEN